VVIQSKRLLEEMKVFIWRNGRAEAQGGYNDDLVMAFGIGMYLRDTSLRFQQQSQDLTRASLNSFKATQMNTSGVYSPKTAYGDNPWSMNIGMDNEDITWLL
jgi:hypothetical protein